MKLAFYPRLAVDAIRKNRRMYLPYMLTCIGMVMMHYIILSLSYSEAIEHIQGATTVQSLMGFGGWIIALFSAVFLLYTNSFLIRRRKREFGLYNILGMGKRNIARVLFWETLIIAVLSLGVGLGLGIALSKLAELALVNIMQSEVTYTVSVSLQAVCLSALSFGAIFALLFFNTLRQVHFSGAMELLRAQNAGEKPPKGNLLLGLLGIAILTAGYYIAVTNADPIHALTMFFVAVILVIVGTYLTFISFSVIFCRFLQRRKGYYYKSNHFISVASMVYRMKRNGAGLGSICIIATMVLVMLSSTFSLFFGMEDSLHARYPREINFSIGFDSPAELNERVDDLRERISQICNEHGVQIGSVYDYRTAGIGGLLTGDTVECDVSTIGSYDMANVHLFNFMPLEDYNRLHGKNETLDEGQALLYCNRANYTADTLNFNNGPRLQIKKHLTEFIGNADAAMSIVSTIYVIVPDLTEGVGTLYDLTDYRGEQMVSTKWIYNFDTGISPSDQITLGKALNREISALANALNDNKGLFAYSFGCRAAERNEYYSLFGSLLFLGIMLSAVFLLAAVLIIYYKQVSEGYEDQGRFAIMKKVGMTGREIRKSINSQLLTVFFLPLLLAGCHLAFAFPMIRGILLCFNLNNAALFAGTTAVSFAIFGLFYAIVYRITSGAYYNIVNGAHK